MGDRSNINLVGNTTQGQNVGSGTGVFKDKYIGNILRYKTLSSLDGTSLAITSDADNIYLSAATGGGGGSTYWSSGATGLYPSAGESILMNADSAIQWSGATTYIKGDANNSIVYHSGVEIDGTPSAHIFDTQNNLCGSGRIASFRDGGAERFSILQTGTLNVPSGSFEFSVGAGTFWQINGNYIQRQVSGGPALRNATSANATATLLPHQPSATAGIGGTGGDVTMTSASNIGVRTDNQGNAYLPNISGNSTANVVYIDTSTGLLTYGAGGGGGGSITGGANGLSTSGANITLGGTLTGNTTISGDSNTFNVVCATSICLDSHSTVSINSNAGSRTVMYGCGSSCIDVGPLHITLRANSDGDINYRVNSATYCHLFSGGTVHSQYCMNAPDFTLTSDERQKTNICSYSPTSLDVDYKQFELCSIMGRTRYGVIAQELNCCYPELVNCNGEGMMSVSYIDLLVREVAYLKNKVEELEKKIL